SALRDALTSRSADNFVRDGPLRQYLGLETAAGLEPAQRLGVPVEWQPVGDEYPRIQDPGGEQFGRPLVAVQYGHRPGDRDLLVVDAIRLDGGARRVVGNPELQVRPARADPADAVLDRGRVAGGIHHELPAVRTLEVVCGRHRLCTADVTSGGQA